MMFLEGILKNTCQYPVWRPRLQKKILSFLKERFSIAGCITVVQFAQFLCSLFKEMPKTQEFLDSD
jgi:hypothetical protein